MDEIRLEIENFKSQNGINIQQYDINVILNGETLNHNIFNGFNVIAASEFEVAQFDLFTCSCGHAGCAGYFEPVVQNKTQTTVKWTFPNDNSYKVKKLEYEFNKNQFEEEFKNLKKTMLQLEKKDIYFFEVVNDSDDYKDSNYNEMDENQIIEIDTKKLKGELLKSLNWCKNYYQSNENFNNMIEENFSSLDQKKFYFKYNDTISENGIDLSNLICSMLNEWPSHAKQKLFLKKAIKAGKVIEDMIETQNNKLFIKMVHNSYKDFDEDAKQSVQSLIERFDYELTSLIEKGSFDLEKFKLIVK